MSPRRRILFAIALAVMFVPSLAFAGGGGEFEEYQAKGWLWMYLGAFGAGFLTSLTPCVYPMIPITLGIFGARGADVSKAKRLALATSYVVGMGVTYSVLGVTFAMLGGSAGTLLANPFVVIPIVVLFVVMAASLFGAFELNLPYSWQQKLNQVGGKGFGGAFAMGLVGGFIAAPCTGPFLAGLLAFTASTKSVFGGGSLLFVYALGMGVLFWVLAAAAMSLPKSGRWMDVVKSVGGVLLLFGAIYFLKPLLPGMRKIATPDTWFLFASLGLTVVGVLLGALHLSFSGTSIVQKGRKLLGILFMIAGLFGAYAWTLTPKKHLPFERVEKVAFEKARAENKGVMVDFAASWCGPCEELEKVFGDSDVYDAILADFVPIQFDVSDFTDENNALKERYGAKTLPAVIFLDTQGNVVARLKDLVEVEEMLEILGPAKRKVRASRVGSLDPKN
jgi:thiol:disulfide interchange protein DsbD